MRIPVVAFAVLVCGCVSLAANASESQPTEQSVRAVEDAWSEAFVSGDTATLEALLDPAYVSVNPMGAPRSKAEIIERARTYAAANPGAHGTPLPATSHIDVRGDAAIVTHTGGTDRSVDVFHFENGRWRAWYSQHTTVAPAN